MKWYSVKKYKPPACNEVLIRIEKKSGQAFIYDRYLTGSFEDYSQNITNPWNWALVCFDEKLIDLDIYEVTHFAIIEPVEVEE